MVTVRDPPTVGELRREVEMGWGREEEGGEAGRPVLVRGVSCGGWLVEEVTVSVAAAEVVVTEKGGGGGWDSGIPF